MKGWLMAAIAGTILGIVAGCSCPCGRPEPWATQPPFNEAPSQTNTTGGTP